MITIDVNFISLLLADVGSMISGLALILEFIFGLQVAFFVINKLVRMFRSI